MTKLTRNVTRDHVIEIFNNYGTVKNVDVSDARGGGGGGPGRGRTATVEFETHEMVEKAVKHMDEGKQSVL